MVLHHLSDLFELVLTIEEVLLILGCFLNSLLMLHAHPVELPLHVCEFFLAHGCADQDLKTSHLISHDIGRESKVGLNKSKESPLQRETLAGLNCFLKACSVVPPTGAEL